MNLTFTQLLSWSIGAFGVLLFYASLSYETEEGRIQSLLELWWIKVDDYRKQSLSWHVAFIKMLASVATTIFDRLFGTRLLSIQAVGVSICYSLVSMGFLALILSRVRPASRLNVADSLWIITEGVVWGSLPALLSRWKLKVYGVTPIHLWFIALIAYHAWELKMLFVFLLVGFSVPEAREGAFLFLGLFVAVFVGIGLFPIFIALMRVTMRKISISTSPMQIVGLSLLNVSPGLMFYIFIVRALDIFFFLTELNFGLSLFLIAVALFGLIFNSAFILSGALFVCLALTMLIHRLFWPAISRPLYKLQALGISKRPKVFATIGVILFGVGFGKHDWISTLADKLF